MPGGGEAVEALDTNILVSVSAAYDELLPYAQPLSPNYEPPLTYQNEWGVALDAAGYDVIGRRLIISCGLNHRLEIYKRLAYADSAGLQWQLKRYEPLKLPLAGYRETTLVYSLYGGLHLNVYDMNSNKTFGGVKCISHRRGNNNDVFKLAQTVQRTVEEMPARQLMFLRDHPELLSA